MKSLSVCMFAVLLSFFPQAQVVAQSGQSSDWRLELVPSRNSEGKGAVLYAKKPLDKFYIILHNTSGKDLRIWRDWCPWGYDNLSLTAELEGGKKVELVKISKTAEKWGKVYPDAALVRAGKSYVFEVHLAGKTWSGLASLPKEPFKITINYEIKVTPEADDKKVWVGKVSTEPIEVSVRK